MPTGKELTVNTFLKTVLFFAQFLVAAACFSQGTVGPTDILVYERVENPTAGSAKNSYTWSGGAKTHEVRLERRATGELMLIAVASGKISLLDPKTFAMTDIPSTSFQTKMETDKVGSDFAAGQRWKSNLARPYEGSCGGMLTNELYSTSAGEIAVSTSDGKFSDAKGLSIIQDGTYSSCTASGKYFRNFHYSTALQLPTMIESVTHKPNGTIASGYRMTLKEIRRAQ